VLIFNQYPWTCFTFYLRALAGYLSLKLAFKIIL
jgi:hypothetical protein